MTSTGTTAPPLDTQRTCPTGHRPHTLGVPGDGMGAELVGCLQASPTWAPGTSLLQARPGVQTPCPRSPEQQLACFWDPRGDATASNKRGRDPPHAPSRGSGGRCGTPYPKACAWIQNFRKSIFPKIKVEATGKFCVTNFRGSASCQAYCRECHLPSQRPVHPQLGTPWLRSISQEGGALAHCHSRM